MRHRHLGRAALFLFASLALLASGCGDGGGGGGGGEARTDFDDFVIDLVQNRTSDTAEPVAIADRTFRFDEDPAAFDELFK